MSRYDQWRLDTPDRFEDEPPLVSRYAPEDDDPFNREWNPDPDDADPVPQPDPTDLDRFVDDGGAVADPPGGEN